MGEVLADRRIPSWPWPGPIALVERADAVAGPPEAVGSLEAEGPREDWHVFDQWCHLGTAADEATAQALAAGADRRFEPAAYRLLRGALTQQPELEIRTLIRPLHARH